MAQRTRIRQPATSPDAALIREVLERESVGVALLSVPDLVYEYVNPAFQAVAPEKQMVGKRNLDVFPEMEYLGGEVLPKLLESGEPWRQEDVEHRIRRRPGGPLESTYGNVEVQPLTIDGRTHLLVTATETTERVDLRDELDRSRERLVRIVEAISQGFVAIDAERRVTYLNPTAAELMGVSMDDVMGREVASVLPSAWCDQATNACRTVMLGGGETRFEVLDALTGCSFEIHVFPTDDGAVIVIADISERKAAEAERESLLVRERGLRETTERLSEIQRLVTSTLELDEMLRRVSRATAEMLHADAVGVGLYEGDRYSNHALYGLPAEFIHAFVDVTPEAALAIVRETKEPLALADARGDPRFDQALVARFGVRSLILAPFTQKGEVVGCLGVYRREVAPFSTDDVDTARTIAAVTGLASENARLYDNQQRALRLARALDDINHGIHSSLDYDLIMQRALDEATSALGASAGAVFIGVDSASEARYVTGLPKAVIGRRFEGEIFPFTERLISTKDPVAIGPDEMGSLMNRVVARIFGVRSLLAIPIVLRGVVDGGIGLIYREPHDFDAEEIGFARRFGASVSLALDNSELYRRQERVADTLQEALLTLPREVQGLEVAHAYHSATEAAKVGGDFYDVFELEHRTVGLTVGDISGKGLDAAVLTSLVKNAVRAQATQSGTSPAEALSVTNEVLLRGSGYEIFATVFFGLLDLDTGRLTYCSGGHTTTLIGGRNGEVERLPSNSPLVGAMPGVTFHDSVTTLGMHSTMLMYTDGVVEARGNGDLYGEERLVEVLRRTDDGRPERVVRGVIDEVVSFAGGKLSDDVAILAVRRT
jgi:PAS domain S-box-containing protein